jgi:multidrug efflux pump subunit AcrB
VLNLPPIIGLSTSGGFEYQLEALEGQPPTQLGSVMQGLIGAANQGHNLARVFSTFTATNPSIFLDIDRDKAQALGVGISNIFSSLNATLGGVCRHDRREPDRYFRCSDAQRDLSDDAGMANKGTRARD